MSNILTRFPGAKELVETFPEREVYGVNAHVHTPFSFSAFTGIPQLFEMAKNENIAVVGINDFFVTDGYEPFYHEALKTGVFPLFNIEFIGLMKKEQQQKIRINDPNNPGRCYLSGKGLNFPFAVDDRLRDRLIRIVAESQVQVRSMIIKANDWFSRIGSGIMLNYEEIRKNYAEELVRERHIAKAIRIAVFEKFKGESERFAAFTALFDGKEPKSALADLPGLENELRGNLLKAGGKAFVEEDDNTFMNIEEVIDTIVNAGGIPCYPVLLDDRNGDYTEYERDPEELMKKLTKKNIGCIELIPGRNDAGHIERFVQFFSRRGFVIMFGTEHNTPDLVPLTCDSRGNKPLSDEMKRISWEGACVVAAHQYLHATGQEGFVDTYGRPKLNERESFVVLGNAVIQHYRIKTKKYD